MGAITTQSRKTDEENMTTEQNLKETLKQELIRCRKLHIGDTLFITSPELAPEQIRDALEHGKTVTENGVSQWINENEMIVPGQTGSAVYVWKGDKIKVERQLVVKDADGNITRTSLGFAWRKP
jgi:hypothetical protein